MAKVLKRHWEATYSSGLPRRDRASCEYETYVPDPLVGQTIRLDGAVAADVADAEVALRALDARASALIDTEAMARLLLRAESVASSRIEGLEVGPRRLLRAEAASQLGDAPGDVTAIEVLGNVAAMTAAVQSVARDGAITVDLLLAAHRTLLEGGRLADVGGNVRNEQNWIGGSSYNPCSADFVPPPPEYVADLLDDLCRFCNGDDLPAVAQAAIAHAQFETIHPFVDGNGRIGRALIQLVLRRRGVSTQSFPPISLVLATWSRDYIDGLTATRYRGRSTSAQASAGANRWIGLFAAACRRSVGDAEQFEANVSALEESWRERLQPIRAKSATDRLLRALPGLPILTVGSAAETIGRSDQATNEAVGRLVEADVLQQISVGRRNRAFEAGELIDAFTSLERQLASPSGDTRRAPPVRPVPQRRR